ncbi:UDP-N-acetylmuramoyl-tripeptide--D-alanyl-D-alanine ligase [Calidifontibacillus erzurumensis]|uniref:UDP-N-acetylmuramoyl-tripeptide--D-alanyl-D- alanine ligase n=1 Tax=Calidifontibacillus erzurumensis TaxID=2741433 RepID=UPI0035B53312
MKLSLAEISNIFPENLGAAKEELLIIEEVMTDSRKYARKGLFVPIVGERFDGHEFLKDAINHGAIASFWQEDKERPSFLPNDFPLYIVKDTTAALQTLAKYYLQKIKPIVIGITGSNGKTTTKDLVSSVLQTNFKTHQTKGNFNNHIGLPLTILTMPEETEVVILEMGMNNFGEIALLSKIAEPDIAVITNIGEAHIEFLGDRTGIAKAKLEMIEGLRSNGKLIVDGDEPLLQGIPNHIAVIRCGFNEDNDLVIRNVQFEVGSHFFQINGEKYELPLLGRHNVKNASYAIAVGRTLGLSEEQIKTGLKEIKLTGMRLEQAEGKNGALIINDAYNASPTSMKAAVETIKDFDQYSRKVVVLGDMFELGANEEELHRSVAEKITPPITDLITVGEKASWISDEVRKRGTSISVYSFLRKEEALPFIIELLSKDVVILFKASRGAKLEFLVDACRKED